MSQLALFKVIEAILDTINEVGHGAPSTMLYLGLGNLVTLDSYQKLIGKLVAEKVLTNEFDYIDKGENFESFLAKLKVILK